jgi:hypothetical protein
MSDPNTTIIYSGTLVVTTCWCGIKYAVPDNLLRHAHNDGQVIYCPLGHKCHWAESEADRLRKKLEREQAMSTRRLADLDRQRAATEHEKARVRGYQGALAKAKQRSAKGVCPVPGCKRHFVDVERHVASKHPGYVAGVSGG